MKWNVFVLERKFEKQWKAHKPVPLTAWKQHAKRVKTCSYVKADKLAQKLVPGRIQFTREVPAE